MALRILSALLILPVLEIIVLIRLVGTIGFFPTFLIVIAGGLLGIFILRVQGLGAMSRAQDALAKGELPALELLESGFIGLGGLLLLIPGVISDFLALFCLVPVIRRRFAEYLLQRNFMSPSNQGMQSPDNGSVIEGEFKRDP